jgi:hypothetical protein
MENSNNGQDVRRVLCLTRPKAFRRPRAWRFHVRWGMLTGGQELATAQAGAWVLELGPHDVWLGGENYETEYLYRLATGQVVALERPLDGEVEEITEPQAVAAMRAYRSLDEYLAEELGVTLERLCPGLPPFALIKCPLCGGAEFGSVEMASAWCERCNAQFYLRMTAGDPGWVVDVTWRYVRFLEVRYVMPEVESLTLHMVLKDSGDPRDLRHEPEGGCSWWSAQGRCKPDALYLTGPDHDLRPGLHMCRIGTLYGWKLTGAIPTPREVKDAQGWTIDGDWWPWSATLQRKVLDQHESGKVRQAITALQRLDDPRLEEAINALARLVQVDKGNDDPVIWVESLPPLTQLGEGERYLLHHWLIHHGTSGFGSAWPVWYVVRPEIEDNRLVGWQVVRRDVCPRCGHRVIPGQPNDHHSYCQTLWSETSWEPAGAS